MGSNKASESVIDFLSQSDMVDKTRSGILGTHILLMSSYVPCEHAWLLHCIYLHHTSSSISFDACREDTGISWGASARTGIAMLGLLPQFSAVR